MAKYAIQSYSVQAVEYCLKPLYYCDLRRGLERIRLLKACRDKHLRFPYQGTIMRIKTSSVYYLESQAHTIFFHTARSKITKECHKCTL